MRSGVDAEPVQEALVTTYDEVTAALGCSVAEFEPTFETGVNLFNYQPRTVVPPCAIIKPQAHRTVEYRVALSNSVTAKWHFLVMLVVGQVSEQDAQRQVGVLVSPNSLLIQAVNATKFPHGGYAKVTEGAISQMAVKTRDGGEALYTYAQLSVFVQA